jgi:hypothetical protein
MDWIERVNTLLDVFEIDRMPHRGWVESGIYMLATDQSSSPVYIGQSCDISRRVKQHRYSRRFSFNEACTRSLSIPEELRYPVEMALIGLLRPKANGIWTRWGRSRYARDQR